LSASNTGGLRQGFGITRTGSANTVCHTNNSQHLNLLAEIERLRARVAELESDRDTERLRSQARQDPHAEHEHTQLLARAQAAFADAAIARSRLVLLSEATSALSMSLDYPTTLANVARLAVAELADWCGVEIVNPDQTIKRVAVAAADPSKHALAQELLRYPVVPHMPSTPALAIETRQPILRVGVADADVAASASDARHLEILRAMGMISAMSIPLIAHGRLLGSLSFVRSHPDRPYGQSDLVLAEELARRAALALDNAWLYQETRESAQRVDETLALLDSLLASAPFGFAFYDRDLRFLRINETMAAVNGQPVEAHLGRTLAEGYPPPGVYAGAAF